MLFKLNSDKQLVLKCEHSDLSQQDQVHLKRKIKQSHVIFVWSQLMM